MIKKKYILVSLLFYFFCIQIGAQTANNCYAVLINGGIDTVNNYEGFYNNMAFVYKTLVNEYNYDKSNIYVLNSDGSDNGDDMYIDTESEPYYEIVSSPQDLDGDDFYDIDDEASLEAIEAVFDELESELTSSDFLFIYLTGNSVNYASERYYTWHNPLRPDYDFFSDSDIGNYIDQVDAGRIVVLAAYPWCGSLSDNLEDSDRVLLTSNDYDEVGAWKAGSQNTYEEFTYFWTSAIAGETPDQTTVDADYNEDGNISIYEAYSYADSAVSNNITPLYYSGTSTLGENMTMHGQTLCVTTLDLHDINLTLDAELIDCYIDVDNVTITNNVDVILNAEYEVIIHKDFSIQLGSTLLIQ